AASPSVTTSVWPSSRRLRRPGAFSPIHPMTFGRPGATSCTSTMNPSRRIHASTKAATLASLASGSPGGYTLGIRTRERVSSATSSASMAARSFDSAVTAEAALLQRERENDRVEPDHPMLFARDVEVVALDLFGILLEGDDGAQRRHLAKGIGALVEAVPPPDDFAVADRRALGTVHAHVGRRVGHESHEEVDAVHLKLDVSH